MTFGSWRRPPGAMPIDLVRTVLVVLEMSRALLIRLKSRSCPSDRRAPRACVGGASATNEPTYPSAARRAARFGIDVGGWRDVGRSPCEPPLRCRAGGASMRSASAGARRTGSSSPPGSCSRSYSSGRGAAMSLKRPGAQRAQVAPPVVVARVDRLGVGLEAELARAPGHERHEALTPRLVARRRYSQKLEHRRHHVDGAHGIGHPAAPHRGERRPDHQRHPDDALVDEEAVACPRRGRPGSRRDRR